MSACNEPVGAAGEPLSLLETPFPAALTRKAAMDLRRSLEISTSPVMLCLFAFLTRDRDGMVDLIRSVAKDSGDREAVRMIEAVGAARENIEELCRLAEMAEARALLAMHITFGLTLDDTDPEFAAARLEEQRDDAPRA